MIRPRTVESYGIKLCPEVGLRGSPQSRFKPLLLTLEIRLKPSGQFYYVSSRIREQEKFYAAFCAHSLAALRA
jgi:hypothetical protein